MTATEPVGSPEPQPSDDSPQQQTAPAPSHNDDSQSDQAGAPPTAGQAPSGEEDEVEEGEEQEGQGEENPPLPPGPPPGESRSAEDDGWQPVWDSTYGSYYFFNSLTGETTWSNPRVPGATVVPNAAVVAASNESASPEPSASLDPDQLQYNPAIHGDYDPTAAYAQTPDAGDAALYTTTAAFNRFTGKFTPATSHQVPENYNDENKSKRQMEFYFDVDAAANSHDGKSLKAERQTKKLSKKELKQFKEKRRARKEEKRKAWLKD